MFLDDPLTANRQYAGRREATPLPPVGVVLDETSGRLEVVHRPGDPLASPAPGAEAPHDELRKPLETSQPQKRKPR